MKLVTVKCPNCGSNLELDADSKQTFCSFCGTKVIIDDEVQHHQIHYDNAEDAGYQFEKGRQRAQAESGMYIPRMPIVQDSFNPPKKRKTFWWVMGWIFVFPLPLTILLIRNKKISKALKIIIIALAWLLYIGIIGSSSSNNGNNSSTVVVQPSQTNKANVSTKATSETKTEKPAIVPSTKVPETTKDNVPSEYKSALLKAALYSETMHMSKAAIYEQLTSEYGEKFPADAAQYAIDNLVANYEINAIKKAEMYSDTMFMSKAAIYDQLISEYGEKFTKEEAQYAIDHLDADYKANALSKAKTYLTTMNMSKAAIYDQLISEYGEKFTKEEAQYAIDHLDD